MNLQQLYPVLQLKISMLCWARERRAHVLLVQFKELRIAVGNTLSTTLATLQVKFYNK